MNRRTLAIILAALMSLSVLGCGSGEKKETPTDKPSGSDQKASTSTGDSAGSAPKADEKKPEQAAISPDKIPANLKNDAFEYYGLSNTAPKKYSLKLDNGAASEGEQALKLIDVKDDKLVYRLTRSGSLAPLGDNDAVVKNDGVWSENSTYDPSMKPSIEIPVGLKPGKTWSTSTEMTTPQGKTKQDVKFEVVGIEKVKTKVAEREGILVKGVGTNEMGSEKFSMVIKCWYVKGVGLAKMEVNSKDSKGTSKTMVIEELN